MNVSPVDAVTKRAVAYGIPGVLVDGNDVFEVIDATRRAIERAQSRLRPNPD